ncbi:MAG: hypothetical protein JO094_08245, partial [Hyphomicrobiales bacterium]|nr:hypothetical protein [Hyphomicrobiales bacterium]
MSASVPLRVATMDRRVFALGAGAGIAALLSRKGIAASADVSASGHAVAMHGEPALAEGFAHFPYADPAARRGGRLVLGVQGTFDSLNPLIVSGNASDAV